MAFYHGTNNDFTAHVGQCWTDEQNAAETYGTRLAIAEIDLSSLAVEHIDAYDADTNEALGDDGVEYTGGADVIVYDDLSATNGQMTTYRMMTPAAVAAVTLVEVLAPLPSVDELWDMFFAVEDAGDTARAELIDLAIDGDYDAEMAIRRG